MCVHEPVKIQRHNHSSTLRIFCIRRIAFFSPFYTLLGLHNLHDYNAVEGNCEANPKRRPFEL